MGCFFYQSINKGFMGVVFFMSHGSGFFATPLDFAQNDIG